MEIPISPCFTLLIVMDSLGTLPIFVSLLKHFDPKKQRKIITRELLIALGIMLSLSLLWTWVSQIAPHLPLFASNSGWDDSIYTRH